MIRKILAAGLTSYWEFIQKYPLLSIAFSLLAAAACAGGIYLIIVKFPSFAPCFTGRCGS